MQAIQRLQIPITASAGCSAGALVGGFAASGTPLQAWVETLKNISSQDFWTPDSLSRFFWKMTAHRGRGYTGLSSTRAALKFARDNISATSFEECLYPFHVLAVELSSGKKTVFSTGELAPRMTASAAMPILYEPVRIDGRYRDEPSQRLWNPGANMMVYPPTKKSKIWSRAPFKSYIFFICVICKRWPKEAYR